MILPIRNKKIHECLDLVHLVQTRVHLRTVVNTVMNIQCSQNTSFLTDRRQISSCEGLCFTEVTDMNIISVGIQMEVDINCCDITLVVVQSRKSGRRGSAQSSPYRLMYSAIVRRKGSRR